jgi:small subunit ribosomal protein S16
MLIIRLIRTGKKNAPSFRVVLIEKTAPPQSGKFLEILGNYNPRLKEINLKKERIKHWLAQGVQTSETVHNLLVQEGIIEGPKIQKRFRAKKKKAEGVEEEKEKKGEETTQEGAESKETAEEIPQATEDQTKEEAQEKSLDKPEKETKIKEE